MDFSVDVRVSGLPGKRGKKQVSFDFCLIPDLGCSCGVSVSLLVSHGIKPRPLRAVKTTCT